MLHLRYAVVALLVSSGLALAATPIGVGGSAGGAGGLSTAACISASNPTGAGFALPSGCTVCDDGSGGVAITAGATSLTVSPSGVAMNGQLTTPILDAGVVLLSNGSGNCSINNPGGYLDTACALIASGGLVGNIVRTSEIDSATTLQPWALDQSGVSVLFPFDGGATFLGPLTQITDAGTTVNLLAISGCSGAAPSAKMRREEGLLGFDKAQAADAGFKVPFSAAAAICAAGWTASYTDGGIGIAASSEILSVSTTGITLHQSGTPANGTMQGWYWVDGY